MNRMVPYNPNAMSHHSSRTPNTYEKWCGFVCGHPHQKRGRRVVATLKAFFDDTGTHADSMVMGIAGCISTIERWDAFSYEWDEHLASWDLEWFHMVDAETKSKSFKGWTDVHRDSRIGILSRLVANTIVCSVGTVLPHQILQNVNGKMMELSNTQRHPYWLAFRQIFNGIDIACRACGANKSDVEIVFAEQKGIGPRTLEAWRQFIRDEGFQEPVFRPSKGLPPLQAADMVAWFLQHRCKSREPQNVRPRHKALQHQLLFSRIPEEVILGIGSNYDRIVEEADKKFGPRSPAQPKPKKRSRK